ncbi:hypothetical protein N5F13_15850 [Comamonas thiooxydans]|uniref:hypothetical protein n=1 Tax=Comamonas thiooxydans TaxID=363952 RepID=UPI00244983A8|nr:hypothetical protein [Comamonas thiooxydans]MDH1475984.1 hypothetical protein [Comamonas thiooxydans]
MGATWVNGTWENMLVVGVSMFVVFSTLYGAYQLIRKLWKKDWDKKPNQLVVMFMTFSSGFISSMAEKWLLF